MSSQNPNHQQQFNNSAASGGLAMHVVNARAKKSKGKGINDDVSHEFNGSHLAGNLNSENKSSKGQKSNYEGYSSNAYNSNMNNQIQLFEDEMGSNFV